MDFPLLPSVVGELQDDNSVKISLDTYVNLAKFKVDYEGLIEYYKQIKQLKGDKND